MFMAHFVILFASYLKRTVACVISGELMVCSLAWGVVDSIIADRSHSTPLFRIPPPFQT